MQLTNSLLTVLLGAGLASAHMEMTYPPPFRSKFNDLASDVVDYNMIAPLEPSGSNFPCKGYHSDLGSKEGASVATWSPGEKQKFSITGGAFHGGGSCQASLSYDKGKTFKVIHSFIGNCPGQGDSSFDFVVPKDAPSGEAVFAWTWFNQIGNREMYMNCAAVTIGGGKSSKAKKREAIKARADGAGFSSRPDIFVANVNNGCKTADSMDVVFPDPGAEVTEASQKSAKPEGSCAGGSGGGSGGSAPPSGGEGGNGGSGGGDNGSGAPPPADGSGSGSGSGSGESNPGIPSQSAPAAGGPTGTPSKVPQPPAVEQPASSAPGGVFITKPADDASPAPTDAPEVPAPTEPSNTLTTVITPPAGGDAATPTAPADGGVPEVPAEPETPAPTQPSTPEQPAAPGGGAGGQTPGAKCTQEGDWNCIGGNSFQRCASGQWSVVMQMAAGTKCKEGMGAFSLASKRGFRFNRSL